MVCSTFYSIKAVSVPCGWAYRPLGIGYEGLMPQCLPATLVGLVSVYALYSDGKKIVIGPGLILNRGPHTCSQNAWCSMHSAPSRLLSARMGLQATSTPNSHWLSYQPREVGPN